MEGIEKQVVTVPLSDYNQLYEHAYLNKKRAELDAEKKHLAEAKAKHEEDMRQKDARQQEAFTRRAREQRNAVSSKNWLLVKHMADGLHKQAASARDVNMAAFTFSMEFRVFDDEWTVIPLVDAQVITDDWKVCYTLEAEQQATDRGEPGWSEMGGNSEAAWKQLSLTGDTLLLVQELDDGPPRQVLAVSKAGLYQVKFTAHVFVHSNRNLHSFSLNLVHPLRTTCIRFAHEGKTAMREFNVSPASQYAVQEEAEAVKISICLPPTKTVEVKWRGVDPAEAEAAQVSETGEKLESEPVQVTVTHDAMHSIADGVLQSNHTLKYTLDSEQTTFAKARFVVLGGGRVTSVTGHGVLSWKATAHTMQENPETGTLVEVSFKSSLIADNVILIMATEKELNAGDVTLPVVMCEGVLRQTGSQGVVKVANVEVHELPETKGVARVAVDELPEELRYLTTRPIMFAYKYLSPSFTVKLSVVKHEQVGVQEAIAESAFYQALVVDAQSMHRLLLVMQNSNQQYLELRGLPSDARLTSLTVNSIPAKPVKGKAGSLLIPLLVGTANDGAGMQKTSVELTYLSQHAPLAASGSLELPPPRLDIPISTFLMDLQFPESYKLNFKGTLQKVSRFTHPLPQPVSNDKGTDIVEHGFDFRNMAQQVKTTGVNASVPKSGQLHRFQQLLVVDDGATLSVDYETPAEEAPATPNRLWDALSCGRRRR